MASTATRNWAAMLKEKKAVAVAPKAVVTLPEDKPAPKPAPKPAEPSPAVEVVAAEPPAQAEKQSPVVGAAAKATPPPAKATPPPAPAAAPTAAEPVVPAVAYTAIGPVSLPEALAKLVKPTEFRFAGSLAAPPVVEETIAAPVAPPQPTSVAAPAAAAPPVVTSSSDIHRPQHWSGHHAPYNPPVNYFVPQYDGPRPYGGELGSVPRYYNAERHFSNVEHQYNAQPYHPTYQTPHYPSQVGFNPGYQYGAYESMYPSYYPGQGAPYMGGRLQANPPYYPPRDPPQQQ